MIGDPLKFDQRVIVDLQPAQAMVYRRKCVAGLNQINSALVERLQLSRVGLLPRHRDRAPEDGFQWASQVDQSIDDGLITSRVLLMRGAELAAGDRHLAQRLLALVPFFRFLFLPQRHQALVHPPIRSHIGGVATDRFGQRTDGFLEPLLADQPNADGGPCFGIILRRVVDLSEPGQETFVVLHLGQASTIQRANGGRGGRIVANVTDRLGGFRKLLR